MEGTVVIIELGLVALLLLLAFRMINLCQREPFPGSLAVAANPPSAMVQATPTPSSAVTRYRPETEVKTKQQRASGGKASLVTQLHILFSLQERDCREHGLVLAEAPTLVREYSAAWLYGAACALCDNATRHSNQAMAITAQLISRKTGLRQSEVVQALANLTRDNTLLVCFRNGIEGAEHWSEKQFVPAGNGLYGVITANTFL